MIHISLHPSSKVLSVLNKNLSINFKLKIIIAKSLPFFGFCGPPEKKILSYYSIPSSQSLATFHIKTNQKLRHSRFRHTFPLIKIFKTHPINFQIKTALIKNKKCHEKHSTNLKVIQLNIFITLSTHTLMIRSSVKIFSLFFHSSSTH